MLQLTTKLMNRFSYSITTHFIPSNKDYHSCCNPHSVYQTCPKNETLRKNNDAHQKNNNNNNNNKDK